MNKSEFIAGPRVSLDLRWWFVWDTEDRDGPLNNRRVLQYRKRQPDGTWGRWTEVPTIFGTNIKDMDDPVLFDEDGELLVRTEGDAGQLLEPRKVRTVYPPDKKPDQPE